MYNKNVACTFYFILTCVIMQVSLFVYIIFYHSVSSLVLDKVVILSRHNARTPLSKNLHKMTPYQWPEFEEKPGFLTKRGFLLEEYMGKYFYTWLSNEGILPKGCPSEKELYIYANFIQRTLYSAKAFTKGFPNCNITVHHESTNSSDPIFTPFIHNTTIAFKNIALKEMKSVLNHLDIKKSYRYMENVLNYENSSFCIVDEKCDMNKEVNQLNIVASQKPKLSGPLKISNEAVDAFLMAYYNGFDLNEVAWGKLNVTTKWDTLLKLSSGYHNVTYNTTHVANDLARPLILYLKDLFLYKDVKVNLLMGHDANINVLVNAMKFKPYFLKNNFVSTPVGGKIVFQKWLDKSKNTYLLKIDYVYQSNEQLRNALVLSSDKPPQFEILELEKCKINNNGYCLWDDFVMFLNDFSFQCLAGQSWCAGA